MSKADEVRQGLTLRVNRTIAMDRLLFLGEHESVKSADIVVGWDYDVSPRNLVLMAEKW